MSNIQSNYLVHDGNNPKPTHDDHNHSNMDHSVHKHSHNHGVGGHSHAHNFRDTNGRMLFWCLLITFGFSFVEGIGGYITNSVTLKTDAVHMLTDAAGLLLAYIANIISKRPATINLTFGFGKAEAIGALVNCVFTIVLTLGLLIEAITRFFNPVAVAGGGLFIIACLGLLVNGGVALVLSKGMESLNTRAAFIHALGDMLGSGVAIIAGGIIYMTGFSMADPILSVFLIIFMIVSNYKIIKASSIVLMAGVPAHLSYEQVGRDLEAIPGIISVHDLHIWYMSANQSALSAHIVARDPMSWQKTLILCQEMLEEKHQIEHVTLQHEFEDFKHKHCDQ
ncbi:MAG: cation transporter [Burkholderiales bacterium]|jgi:cobalt-zinc-cadmium efflux system protein|nr:cation transporter [Burkholderiales bacterium]